MEEAGARVRREGNTTKIKIFSLSMFLYFKCTVCTIPPPIFLYTFQIKLFSKNKHPSDMEKILWSNGNPNPHHPKQCWFEYLWSLRRKQRRRRRKSAPRQRRKKVNPRNHTLDQTSQVVIAKLSDQLYYFDIFISFSWSFRSFHTNVFSELVWTE